MSWNTQLREEEKRKLKQEMNQGSEAKRSESQVEQNQAKSEKHGVYVRRWGNDVREKRTPTPARWGLRLGE